MAVPGFENYMRPILELAADRQEHSLQEARERLAEKFQLSEGDRRELLPSGTQKVFDNRVAWAKSHLTKAGLIETTKRAHFKITDEGETVLKDPPEIIKVKYLMKYKSFRDFRGVHSSEKPKSEIDNGLAKDSATPTEIMESAYQEIRADLSGELITKVLTCSPGFFEKLVLDLLVRMGYGGSRKDAAEAVGRSGDGGIDGIIKEDKLGLDAVYIQAKRWEGTVSRPELQKFVGALQGQQASKGVFITTSKFSKGAIDYVSKVVSRIVLIDGRKLADLMIDYGVGVSTEEAYEIKKMDTDYFDG